MLHISLDEKARAEDETLPLGPTNPVDGPSNRPSAIEAFFGLCGRNAMAITHHAVSLAFWLAVGQKEK